MLNKLKANDLTTFGLYSPVELSGGFEEEFCHQQFLKISKWAIFNIRT